jgi:signal transduction histidine kinase
MAANAQLMAENERLKEETEAKVAAMRGMIGNVAHDLKTPLAAFIGGIDLINDIALDAAKIVAAVTAAGAGAGGAASPVIMSPRQHLLSQRHHEQHLQLHGGIPTHSSQQQPQSQSQSQQLTTPASAVHAVSDPQSDVICFDFFL